MGVLSIMTSDYVGNNSDSWLHRDENSFAS